MSSCSSPWPLPTVTHQPPHTHTRGCARRGRTKAYPAPAYGGLVLPYNTGATDDGRSAAVNDSVNPFLGKVKVTWEQAIIAKGGLKSDLSSLDVLKQLVIKEIRGLADMPKDFKHFGNDDFADLLCVILATNPFFTASLTPRSGGGFELISYDPVPDKGDRVTCLPFNRSQLFPRATFRLAAN